MLSSVWITEFGEERPSWDGSQTSKIDILKSSLKSSKSNKVSDDQRLWNGLESKERMENPLQ